MAQTKTAKPKVSKSNKPTKTKRASSTAKKRTGRSTNRGQTKAKRPAPRRSSNGPSSSIKAVRDAIGDAGEKAGHATSQVASKGKIPLIAGGAALVGAASGMALNAARSGSGTVLGMKVPKRKRVKIRSKDLAKTANDIASFGEKVGAVSTGIRHAQEVSGNGNGMRNSPLEVLLQGLTRRR
jgi:hypothetical protein